MIGRQRTGILSTNHMRVFRVAFSKAETGFKVELECESRVHELTDPASRHT